MHRLERLPVVHQPITNSQPVGRRFGPLVELLRLLDRVQVVILLGNEARTSWDRLEKREPELAKSVRPIATRHASNQAFIGTPPQRDHWKREQLNAFHEAAAVVRGESPRPRVEPEAAVWGRSLAGSLKTVGTSPPAARKLMRWPEEAQRS